MFFPTPLIHQPIRNRYYWRDKHDNNDNIFYDSVANKLLDKSYNIKYLVSFVLFVGIFQVKCTIITQIKIQKKFRETPGPFKINDL